ncbi:hypothetical protein [Streptomyces albidus (ex Kaewkla and Franco 2022)]|uniref:hypothetical protein n=1 Tax=Streptomyces albidus (ex Kaewkla and Franco 2022) TaxID=722709 RepID=UPI0015EF8B60|nr:hypothetical protein [Streptomyces albidus (ex Kaewkla and Franco 2022)]
MFRQDHSTLAQLLKLAAALGLVAALALGLASFRQTPTTPQEAVEREKRYNEVLEDAHPSVEDVVEISGAPTEAHRADDGALMLMYHATYVEDDEGPAAYAWRVYDAGGKKVAEHAEHSDAEDGPPTTHGLPDGFLLPSSGDSTESGPVFVDTAGKRRALKSQAAPLVTRPGDRLIAGDVEPRIYRPSTRTEAPLAGLEHLDTDVAAVGNGVAYGFGRSGSREQVHMSERGREWSEDLPAGCSGLLVAAEGETAVVALGLGPRGSLGRTQIDSLFVTSDSGRSWRSVPESEQLPLGSIDDSPDLYLDVLSDGRIVLGEQLGRTWIADDGENRSFHEVDRPVPFVTVKAEGRTLVAVADSEYPDYDLVEGEGLWISEDGGRSWELFDDGRVG